MKQLIFCALILSIVVTGCLHKGAQSKYVKCYGYSLVGDGNNNDSSFFRLSYENKSGSPLKEPFVRMVIKDTTDKFFKPILFSDSKSFPDVPAHSSFTVDFYSKNFEFSNEVGKVKLYLSWTNSKGRNSIRRKVEYE
jgi:hypothetical protein